MCFNVDILRLSFCKFSVRIFFFMKITNMKEKSIFFSSVRIFLFNKEYEEKNRSMFKFSL